MQSIRTGDGLRADKFESYVLSCVCAVQVPTLYDALNSSACPSYVGTYMQRLQETAIFMMHNYKAD